jgi:hypothetical protein
MDQDTKHKEKKVDKAVDMTFPASDATAHGGATATEPAARPADRQAPHITQEQIDQAQRGEGHKHQPGSSPDLASSSQPVDHPDQETVEVRQGTGPRATVSVLFVSLIMAAVAGVAVVAYFTLG